MKLRLRILPVAVAALATVLTGCSDDEDDGGNAVTIEMKDFSYDVSGTLTAGVSTVTLENTGDEFHMVAFSKLQAGKTLADVRRVLESEDQSAGATVFAPEEINAPGAVMSPGTKQRLTTPFLTPGKYALICFIPTEGEGPPHFVKGMLNELTVEAGNVPAPTVEADATFTVNDGSVDGPRTLPDGEVTINVVSSGRGPHEFLILRKKDNAVTYEALDQAFDQFFEGPEPPAKGAAGRFPAVIEGGTFDIPTGNTVTITLDLEPGNYLIGCARDPGDDEPGGTTHRNEIIQLTVT